MTPPRVSVLLPVHNGERFLRGAVDSMLNQTYQAFEIVVVNDHSTDRTREILGGYSDPRICVFDNTGDQGFDASLNLGLQACRGEFVARMDADDVSVPTRLERQVAFLDANPSIGVLGTNYQPIDEDGADRGRPARHLATLPGHVRWRLLSYNCVNHPTAMIRATVLRDIGGYDASTFPADDYDLWLRASQVTLVANLPDVLLRYRLHGGSISSTRRREAAAQELEVARRGQSRVLGRSVSRSTAHLVRDPSALAGAGRDDALLAAEALRGLADACLAEPTLSSSEQHEVASGAARRLLRLVAAALPARPILAACLGASSLPALLRYLRVGLLTLPQGRPRAGQ